MQVIQCHNIICTCTDTQIIPLWIKYSPIYSNFLYKYTCSSSVAYSQTNIHYYISLSLSTGAITYYDSAFGSGYGPIVYSNVNCEGHKDSFTECSKRTYFQFTCYNSDTVGVMCADGKIVSYMHAAK